MTAIDELSVLIDFAVFSYLGNAYLHIVPTRYLYHQCIGV